jgi:hypothetical protein
MYASEIEMQNAIADADDMLVFLAHQLDGKVRMQPMTLKNCGEGVHIGVGDIREIGEDELVELLGEVLFEVHAQTTRVCVLTDSCVKVITTHNLNPLGTIFDMDEQPLKEQYDRIREATGADLPNFWHNLGPLKPYDEVQQYYGETTGRPHCFAPNDSDVLN